MTAVNQCHAKTLQVDYYEKILCTAHVNLNDARHSQTCQPEGLQNGMHAEVLHACHARTCLPSKKTRCYDTTMLQN